MSAGIPAGISALLSLLSDLLFPAYLFGRVAQGDGPAGQVQKGAIRHAAPRICYSVPRGYRCDTHSTDDSHGAKTTTAQEGHGVGSLEVARGTRRPLIHRSSLPQAARTGGADETGRW